MNLGKCLKEFDELLIVKIKENPCLYNHKSKDLRSQTTKQNAWRSVARDLGVDENKCRRRWRLIRDTYVRYKKAQSQESPSQKHLKKEDNPVMDCLNFLDAFVKHRRMIKNEQLDETNSPVDYDEGFGQENPATALTGDSDNDNDNVSSDSLNTPYDAFTENSFQVPSSGDYFSFSKIKREDNLLTERNMFPDRVLYNSLMNGDHNHQKNIDELDCFVKSVSGTLHRFTPKQQAIAKVKIQQLLLDIEFGDENSTSVLEPNLQTAKNT
ncbi:hypothetical protein HELRODRAFT_194043 [Helobdella robusta]|uniref:MADF domain-containing protein n=1 Tax=Helobdella robusta TaxID=6412 RepID=T1FVL8_HELRO|nr:hypothetical protein HELRODRAFT_194043 [Helobdella robusta]ESN93512.1 hypothetical protein HELRODRAFT_194043 [Helobdella robusta]